MAEQTKTITVQHERAAARMASLPDSAAPWQDFLLGKAEHGCQHNILRLASMSNRGIVALDVSKILNRGDEIYVARNDRELLTSINRKMDQFIEDNSGIWERVYERRHMKIIGTIIRFSFMSSSEARNLLIHTTQWGLNPRQGIATGDEQLQRQFAAALSSEN